LIVAHLAAVGLMASGRQRWVVAVMGLSGVARVVDGFLGGGGCRLIEGLLGVEGGAHGERGMPSGRGLCLILQGGRR
jgi:hypothetical protein